MLTTKLFPIKPEIVHEEFSPSEGTGECWVGELFLLTFWSPHEAL